MKSPIHIIIDGADKTGKSTVCRILRDQLEIPLIKMEDMPRYFKDRAEESSEIFNKTISQFKDYSFICDRGYPSSLVYTNYFKRNYNLDYLNTIIRRLTPQVFILRGEIRDTDELVQSMAQKEINELYGEFSKLFDWNEINTTGKTPEEIALEITAKLK